MVEKQVGFPNQTPKILKEANLSILRMGQGKKNRKLTKWMKGKRGLRPPP